jgi:hypothetical protein
MIFFNLQMKIFETYSNITFSYVGGCGFYYPIAPLLVAHFVVQGTLLKGHYVFIFSITCVKDGIVWGALC